MRNTAIYVMLVLLYTITFSGQSAETPENQKPQFRVHVSVTCADATTKSMIESHIKRELRSLGDVELVNKDDATWKIVLIAIPLKSNRNKIGVTSITVMRLYKHTAESSIKMALLEYMDTYETSLSPESKLTRMNKMEEIAEKWGSFPTYNDPNLELILNIKDNDLPNTCKEIVAKFDVEELERSRELQRDFYQRHRDRKK